VNLKSNGNQAQWPSGYKKSVEMQEKLLT